MNLFSACFSLPRDANVRVENEMWVIVGSSQGHLSYSLRASSGADRKVFVLYPYDPGRCRMATAPWASMSV